jgi:hypothetical protein
MDMAIFGIKKKLNPILSSFMQRGFWKTHTMGDQFYKSFKKRDCDSLTFKTVARNCF